MLQKLLGLNAIFDYHNIDGIMYWSLGKNVVEARSPCVQEPGSGGLVRSWGADGEFPVHYVRAVRDFQRWNKNENKQ